MVAKRCAAGPVVLAIDNFQYADPTLSVIWHRLAAAADGLPLLLIGSAGPVPRAAHLDGLRAAATLVLDLGPLDDAAATALITQDRALPPDRERLAELLAGRRRQPALPDR